MSCEGQEYLSPEDIAGQLFGMFEDCTDQALPSVDGVVAVARDVCEVLFPGYGRSRRIHSREDQITESSLQLERIEARLRIEISRAIGHARQATLRLHDASRMDTSKLSAAGLSNRFLQSLPELRTVLMTDVRAAFEGDPAARTSDEIVLCYPGIQAVCVYRMAHRLFQLGVPYLPRILTEWVHRETGIDIHPAAKIGPSFFIDHGTGVVIGETAQIGAGVTLYQGVTLGAWSFPRDESGNLIRGEKRHPTLQDGVTVYSNASILGGTTVIGAGSQIGSGVTLSRTVPANSVVTLDKPSLRIREVG